MTNYLENSICEFTPLFDIDYTKKKNIISCSFFKIEGGGYKNFTKYSNGILYLSKYIKKEMKDFRLRLFIDQSVYNDKEIMNSLKHESTIEIVLYQCPAYITDIDKHVGTFGTLVRLFPIFDFKNNDANIVFVSDIDFISYNDVSKFFKKYMNNIVNYFIKTKKIYKLHTFIFNKLNIHFLHNSINYKDNYIYPYIMCGRVYCFKKINHTLLLNYFKLVNSTDEKLSPFKKFMNNKNSMIFGKDHLLTLFKYKKYIYGIDEYFLNEIYIKHITKNNLSFGCKVKYDILLNLWGYNKYYNSIIPKRMIKIYKSFFEYVIDNYKYTSFKKSIYFIDKKLKFNKLNKNNLTQYKIKLIMKIYIFFIKIYDTKYAEYFNKPFLELIRTPEYVGIIKLNKYKFYNTDEKDIVFEELKLPEKNIKQLKLILNK